MFIIIFNNILKTGLQCLNRDKSQRIGHLGDVKEIIEHPWFKDIDIAKLEKK
jgi:hypothetical protein